MPADAAARSELAPSGTLRIALAVGPASSAMWATRNAATGKPKGVTVDLGAAIAKALDLPCAYVEHASSAKIIEAAASGAWDIGFTPVDAERKKYVLFGPNYFLGESTYMVSAASGITRLEEVDRPGVRVVGVEGTATLRSSRRTLKAIEAAGVTSLEEATTLLTDGKADAVALGRESLVSLAPKFPGARILDGHFHAAGTAIAVPLGKPKALQLASGTLEALKADGTLRRIFDANDMTDAAVAPAGSMS